MAELGDFLLGNTEELNKVHVDVNMLDYDHVAKTDDLTELKAILHMLQVSESPCSPPARNYAFLLKAAAGPIRIPGTPCPHG